MIPIDDELRLAANTRQSIIDILAGVKDAPSYRFNDTSPNWLTENRLSTLLNEHEAGLLRLGAIRVTAHGDCGHPKHSKNSAWSLDGRSGYWRYEIEGGRTDADLAQDGELLVDSVVMESVFDDMIAEQCPENIPCPCNPRRKTPAHTVSRYFAWPKTTDSRMKDLAEVSLTIRDAVRNSQERKARSGIREMLLQTLMFLERTIVTETVEQTLVSRSVIPRPVSK